jgi:formate-dependent nitrite reductase membrane component NrfD
VTAVLLVADLKRPERFLYILLRPNWTSWVARGAFVLTAFGAVAALWMAVLLLDLRFGALAEAAILGAGSMLAILTACYTGWLFFQAKGRVLWMRRGLAAHLTVQAVAAGASFVLALPVLAGDLWPVATRLLAAVLPLHALFVLTERWMAPAGREDEYARAMRATHGGSSLRTVGLGMVLPAVLIFSGLLAGRILGSWLLLLMLWRYEDESVRAGQALPIS